MTQRKKDDDEIGPVRLLGGLLLLVLVGPFYLFPLSLLDKVKAMIILHRKDIDK
jgi:hypothetical protein